MEHGNVVLLLGLYRDLTDTYLYTIIPKKVILASVDDGDFGYIVKWAESEFPDFIIMEDLDGSPDLVTWTEEVAQEWLTEIGCPE